MSKCIFDVYMKDVKGVVEVESSDDQGAIAKVNKSGLKFSSMRPNICVYHIQYAMKDVNRFKFK